MNKVKEFLKELEENEKLLNLVTVIICFGIIGIIVILNWLFG